MSDFDKNYSVNDDRLADGTDETPETDPFASLNKLLDENPAFKGTFDTVYSLLDDGGDPDEMTEVECVEIDGHDYIIAKTIEIAGNTYLYLVNEDDVMDFLVQKVIVEDGEEYITGLDSDNEFELVQAYLQRDFLMQLKEKLKKDDEEAPDDN